MSRPAVFLDRDGTVIEERGFLTRLDALALFPWTADALRLLDRAGFATVVITNQSGVARGHFDEAFLDVVHGEIDRRLSPAGVTIAGYYYCPHHPEAPIERYRRRCRCRKPGPGMIEQACRELDLDPGRSVMVGDRWSDVGAGRAAGARALFVRTGAGAIEEPRRPDGVQADAILDNLMEAAGWILRNSSR